MQHISYKHFKITDEWDTERKHEKIEVYNKNKTARREVNGWKSILGKNEYYDGFEGRRIFYQEIQITLGDAAYVVFGLVNHDLDKYEGHLGDLPT